MKSDRIVFWSILVVIIGVWVAAALGAFSGLMTMIIPVVVTIACGIVGAWQLNRRDRLRRRRAEMVRADDRRNLAGPHFVGEYIERESPHPGRPDEVDPND